MASERLFFVMKWIKTYLRSTITESRLNHLMICSVYKKMLDEIDTTVLVNVFVRGSEHRRHIWNFLTIIKYRIKYC